ncbi:MAG TPA: hypothetical protein VHT24_12265 [Pseudacidobacterium sp.]|jgi:hypothetical protein|nr:hypothetical protein [Pseudacidobacterium sp.]
MCCGQQRAAIVHGRTTGQPERGRIGTTVQIKFTQPSAIMIRGPITGRHYQFHGTEITQTVDARDAAALIRSGYFLRA